NGLAIGSAGGAQLTPAVASNGQDFLVAWADGRAGGNQTDVYSARVTAAGVVQTGNPGIAGTTASEQAPAVASSGTDYLVVWNTSTSLGAGPYSGQAIRVLAATGQPPTATTPTAFPAITSRPEIAW